MKKRFTLPVSVLLFNFIIVSPLYAANWALSFGVNDMLVQGARSLEEAPNGDTSHTLGGQVAIHGKSDSDSAIKQRGYFKVLADRDKDNLDPDHIPVWFMGNYQAKAELLEFADDFSLHMLLDADSKANTVSSIERQIKVSAGVGAEYNSSAFSAGLKTSAGRYALEIDDDVPKPRGYGREDFKRIEYAYTVMADTRFAIGDAFALSMLVQTWQTGSQWLENQYKLQLDYDSDNWARGSTFVVSILHTEYNLEGYNHEDKTVPGYLPILPWSKDTLLQAYIIIPWEF